MLSTDAKKSWFYFVSDSKDWYITFFQALTNHFSNFHQQWKTNEIFCKDWCKKIGTTFISITLYGQELKHDWKCPSAEVEMLNTKVHFILYQTVKYTHMELISAQ